MAENIEQTVKTRRVFYIPGYDPIHPRRYRELYRKEGSAQARISDYQIALSPKKGGGNYGWGSGDTGYGYGEYGYGDDVVANFVPTATGTATADDCRC